MSPGNFSEQIAVGSFLLQACTPHAACFPAPYSSLIMGLVHVEHNEVAKWMENIFNNDATA